MTFPDEWTQPAVETGILMSAVGIALTVRQIWSDLVDGGYVRRAVERYRAWRNRKPKPDTDYGLKDDATVTTFIGVLHGEPDEWDDECAKCPPQASPLLHHTGEQPASRLRLSGPVAAMPVVVELDPERTEPMIPDGVHGYPIGARRIEMTLVRREHRTGEHVAVRPDETTPIFDSLGPYPVLDVDVTFDWDAVVVETRELVGVGA
ncbi:MAG TPA: hypothetical protein VF174_15755 [Micromonosporaceae bacterium]